MQTGRLQGGREEGRREEEGDREGEGWRNRAQGSFKGTSMKRMQCTCSASQQNGLIADDSKE